MSLDNPFETADPWEVSTEDMLPIGNHLVTVVEANDGTAKSSGNPQAELKFENNDGYIRAWEAYHADFLGRIVSLYKSAGIAIPQNNEFDPNDNYRLTAACLARLVGHKLGIVVRDEDDNRNPGQKRRRVMGYVEPGRVGGAANGTTKGTAASEPVASGSSKTDDIPF